MASDPDQWMQKADNLTKTSLTRWAADWKNATALYEKSAIFFYKLKKLDKAMDAFRKASKGQEMLNSPSDAAQHMETVGVAAKELGNLNEVWDSYKQASELYIECRMFKAASNAFARGALALEENSPDKAIEFYTVGCQRLEEIGKECMTHNLYRGATCIYLKHELFGSAATLLLEWGSAAKKCEASEMQAQAYFCAIIVYLYIHDFQQAQECYNDLSKVYDFPEYSYAASTLLSAYTNVDIIEMECAKSLISDLDGINDLRIIELAEELSTRMRRDDLSFR